MSEISDASEKWQFLADTLVNSEADVDYGKMMSAPAITHRGKVFAFYSAKGGIIGMGCRLGRDYDFATLDDLDWQHLAPFKTKPPMKDWIVCGLKDVEKWPELATTALNLARNKS